MHTRTIRSRRTFVALALSCGLLSAPLTLPGAGSVVSAQRVGVAVTGLKRGATGDAVRMLQQALVDRGLPVAGGVDGVFGGGTETALKTFQGQQGLNQSGVVDAATALALGFSSSTMLGLTQGNRGDAVKTLQQRLINAGIAVPGGADGVFGQGTKRAVQDFQASKGFSPTGVVNAATAAALEAIDGSAALAPTNDPAPAPAAAPAPAPAAPAAATNGSLVGLKIGSRGESVKTLQGKIIAAGFTVVGGADGIFGALTSNALKSFQTANGIGASGVVDDATAAALAAVGGGTGGSGHSPGVTNPFVGLRYGSLGADVKALQNALIGAGLSVRGGADGVFGRATEQALKQFQAAKGLSQTGTVDDATANALSSAPSAGSSVVGLTAGALGNTVKELQQALIKAGVTVRGGADGIFGPATANALKSFQTSQGLAATGVVDQATADALKSPKPATPAPSTPAAGFAVFGEKGSRVIALQTALVNAGLTVKGGVDGDFGGGTSAAVMEFQRQNGLNVTGKISADTAAKLGLVAMPEPTAPAPVSVTLGAFPVQGKCYYGDSYGYPRSGGRVHLGVDIIAPEGKLLYAVADGTITKVYGDYPGSLAGNGIRLTMADGTYFFYAHMLGVAEGIAVGTTVKAGQIVGTLGNTGNSGTPHLHLEVHPGGGSAINPYPLVKAIDGCKNEAPLPQP